MRTSLNEIRENEAWLLNRMDAAEALTYRAQLLVNPRRRHDLHIQEKLYAMIRSYGRKQLHAEIMQVHDELFNHAAHRSFREKIARIFKRQA